MFVWLTDVNDDDEASFSSAMKNIKKLVHRITCDFYDPITLLYVKLATRRIKIN